VAASQPSRSTSSQPRPSDSFIERFAGLVRGSPKRRVDIELRLLAGGTPFTPAFNKFPNNALTDGVDATDVPYLNTFPYVATPISGYDQPATG